MMKLIGAKKLTSFSRSSTASSADDEVWSTRELDSRDFEEISYSSVQTSIADVERSTMDVESSSSNHLTARDTNLVITTTPMPDVDSSTLQILTDVESTHSSTFPYTIRSTDVLATDEDSSSSVTNYITASHTPKESVISSGGPETSMTMIATTSPDDATFLSTDSTETKNDFVSATPLKTTGEVPSSTLRAVNLLPNVLSFALFSDTSMLKIHNPSSDDSAVSTTSDTMAIQSTLSYSFDILEEVTSSFHVLSSDEITDGSSTSTTATVSTTTTEEGTTSPTDEIPTTIPPDALDTISSDEPSTTTTSTTSASLTDEMAATIPPDALDIASTDEAFTATTTVDTISPMDGMTTAIPSHALDTISSDEPATTTTTIVGTTSPTDEMTTTVSSHTLENISTDEPFITTTTTNTMGTPSTSLTDEITTIPSDALDTALTTINETTTWISGNKIFPIPGCY